VVLGGRPKGICGSFVIGENAGKSSDKISPPKGDQSPAKRKRCKETKGIGAKMGQSEGQLMGT